VSEEVSPQAMHSLPDMRSSLAQFAPKTQPAQRVQRVYRFPIHELTRGTLSPAID
jgi:hypothetical protein